MINKLASLLRQQYHNQNVDHTLTKDVCNLLTTDSQSQVEVVAENFGAYLETIHGTYPDLQGAYTILNSWY